MPETQFELLGDQKSRIVNILIICIAVALVPISVLVVIFAFQNGWGYAEPLQLVAFGFIWLLVVNRKFLGTQQRATVIMAFLFIAAMSEPFRYGLLAATFPMLAILPILPRSSVAFAQGLSVSRL